MERNFKHYIHQQHHKKSDKKADVKSRYNRKFIGFFEIDFHHLRLKIKANLTQKLNFKFIAYSFYGFKAIISYFFAKFTNVHINCSSSHNHFITPNFI